MLGIQSFTKRWALGYKKFLPVRAWLLFSKTGSPISASLYIHFDTSVAAKKHHLRAVKWWCALNGTFDVSSPRVEFSSSLERAASEAVAAAAAASVAAEAAASPSVGRSAARGKAHRGGSGRGARQGPTGKKEGCIDAVFNVLNWPLLSVKAELLSLYVMILVINDVQNALILS